MAINNTGARLSRGLYCSFDGTRIQDITDASSVVFSGSVPQIDVSSLDSVAREYEPGLSTPGEVSFTALIDPDNPVHAKLKTSAETGDVATLKLVWGNVTGTNGAALSVTDGGGTTRNANVAVTAVAVANGKQTLKIATAVANTIRGLRPGMQVVKYAASIPSNAAYATIESITSTATGFDIVVDRDTTIAAGNGAINIVKPAVEIVYQAYVSTFEGTGSIDAAISTNLSFQVSGSPVINVGRPAITLS